MAITPFKYQPMFEKGKDTTEYYLLTKDYVSVSEFEGNPILKIEKEGLTAMANAAFRDVSFMLRRSHNEQVAKILSDPEASDNDKYVALTFLRNAEVASKGVLPFCQDTGTAIIHGEKGQQVWTGYSDEEALSLGVYKTYTEENLRYSQNAPLNMYDEVNTKCNLPAQIDIEATEGMEYEFLCVTKGGGSANKTYLYQETKAILNPGTLVPFLVEKIKTLGTAACPPYHIAIVIGGTSAIGIYLLNNILGGPGMNSRLNVSLRERRGLVYNVESNLTSYTDTGTFCIYFGCDPADLDYCTRLAYKELKRLRDVRMTSSQLAAAKKQLIGQIGVASDNNENNALGMGKTFLHYNKCETSEAVFHRIEQLTSEVLLEVANEMFAEDYLSTLIYR